MIHNSCISVVIYLIFVKIFLSGYFKRFDFSDIATKIPIVVIFTVFNFNKLRKKNYTCVFMVYRPFKFDLPSFDGLRVTTFKAKTGEHFVPLLYSYFKFQRNI